MSALGQKQTLGKARLMSALPPKADINQDGRDVRFVPKADILRCDLVGTQQERLRDGQAQRLGGLKVDDQVVFGRLLHRKVSRFCTFEDTVDVRPRSRPLA